MKNIYFTVGPSQIFSGFDRCLFAALKIGVPSISHRGRTFEGLFKHTTNSLKRLMNIPNGFHYFFMGSGTEAMERIIENCCEKESFHFVNGAFSKRFYQTAVDLKKNAVKFEAPPGEGFDFFKAQIDESAEVVCFTHNETATGVSVDMEDIYELRKSYPDKIFALDIVSSAPTVEVDFTKIDCAFFSVQKGFGLPAGLGVLLVNERCIDKSLELQRRGVSIGSYHNFPTMLKTEAKSNTPETPNVLAIYELGYVCDLYNKKGVPKIRKEAEAKAKLIYDFLDKHKDFKPFVKKSQWRSKTIIVAETPAGSDKVIKKLVQKGFIVGPGYGEFKDKHIRIANFPAHKLADVKKMLEVLNK